MTRGRHQLRKNREGLEKLVMVVLGGPESGRISLKADLQLRE